MARKKLMIVVATTDPQAPEEIATPFLQATVAAALDFDVEVLLTGRAVRLAQAGEAASLVLPGEPARTVYDSIREAYEAGVIIKASTPTLASWGGQLIAELDETVGSSYLVQEAMDEDTVTLTY